MRFIEKARNIENSIFTSFFAFKMLFILQNAFDIVWG